MCESAIAEQGVDCDIPLGDYLLERPNLALKILDLAESLPCLDENPANGAHE